METFDSGSKSMMLISDIRAIHREITPLIDKFRAAIASVEASSQSDPVSLPGSYWRLVAHCDALVKIRILVERNFTVVESFGVLSVTRYIFELLIWLKPLESDERYGLLYFRMLLEQTKNFHDDLIGQLTREVELLNQFAKDEKTLLERRLAALATAQNGAESVVAAIKSTAAEIDDNMAAHFCLFAEQAKTNGYGVQAHHVKTKVIPDAEISRSETRVMLNAFDIQWLTTIAPINPKRWNWRTQAERVGIVEEYDFIYSYTSRLLHASPASLTTDQKSLERQEVEMFLRYVLVSIRVILALSQQRYAATELH